MVDECETDSLTIQSNTSCLRSASSMTNGAEMSSNAGKQVVIFGGGVAGVQLARDLAQDMKVILVDPNAYFEVPMAAPRNLVHPEFADDALIPYAKALTTVSHLRGRLIEMGSRSE